MQTATTLLLDRWKDRHGLRTDAQAAAKLGVKPSAVSNYRHGRSHAQPHLVEKMAKDCGVDPLAAMAAVEADRASIAADQASWRRYGKGAFMALVGACALGLAIPSGATRTAPTAPLADIGTHYAQRPRHWRTPKASLRGWGLDRHQPRRTHRPRRYPRITAAA